MSAHRNRRLWTHAEDQRLRFLWRESPIDQIAAVLGRKPASVAKRARMLGVERDRESRRCPVPYGHVTIKDACALSGYHSRVVIAALRSAGVTIHAHISYRGRALRVRYIAEAALAPAIAAWMACETINSAAIRRDLYQCTLARWLREAGAIEARGRGPLQRVPTETIDRVVRERTKRAS